MRVVKIKGTIRENETAEGSNRIFTDPFRPFEDHHPASLKSISLKTLTDTDYKEPYSVRKILFTDIISLADQTIHYEQDHHYLHSCRATGPTLTGEAELVSARQVPARGFMVGVFCLNHPLFLATDS